MKKMIFAIAIAFAMTGCASTTTPTITNTKNIKEYILKDHLPYDAFSSYEDSDSIIRLPNGKYIHGTKTLNGKYYDSDKDTGAILASKAEYYTLLAIDVNNYVDEKYIGFDDSDKVIYDEDGSYTNGATVIDENNDEKTVDPSSDSNAITVKEAKEKEITRILQEDAKEEKKNLSSNKSELSKLLPKTEFISRTASNKKNKYVIHYYNVEENQYEKYIKKLEKNGFTSIDSASPKESFLGTNEDNILVNIHYDTTNKIIDLVIQTQ